MENFSRSARKITLTLFLAQSLASAGFITAATINSILGAKLGGSPSWAGVPTAVYLLGGAAAAYVWGIVMDMIGRRGGLALGMIMGVIGAGLALFSITITSMAGFLGGMLLMGTANSAIVLGRFAAAEVHPPEARGRAISNVVLGGTVGAIIGPQLVAPTGKFMLSLGYEELAGAYAIAVGLFACAACIIFVGLRPDPRDLGRKMALLYPESSSASGEARPIRRILRQPAAAVAMLTMVFGQMVMVLLMVITSLHMRDHQHSLGEVSLVISAHTVGMFAFSLISGRLADRWGRRQVILVGSGTLFLACLAAPLSPQVIPLAVALFLLGLGWNFCFVGGSTLLSDQLSPAERARTQGFNDLMVGLAAALGSLSSGIIFAATGFAVMALIASVLSLIPFMTALTWLKPKLRTGELHSGV